MGFPRSSQEEPLEKGMAKRKLNTEELMLLNYGVGEDFWETLGLQGDQTSQSWRKTVLNIHWKDWCWSWSSNTSANWCKELTHWKRPWCWERLKAGGKGNDSRWDGWMASPTLQTWAWASSGSWWWTGRPGLLQSMELQRVRHDWVTELNWTEPTLVFLPEEFHRQKRLVAPVHRVTKNQKWLSNPYFLFSVVIRHII